MRLISNWQRARAKTLARFLTVVLQISFVSATLVWTTPAQAQRTCREVLAPKSESKRQRPEENVLAVHLTDYFPGDGLVHASPENVGRFGVSLHFSLGQPVIDHWAGSWSKKKYGVVLPLSAMRDQILNLLPQDTFVLGDVKLPPEAIVFVPKGEEVPTGFPFKVIQYDPEVGIKNSVSRFIRSSGTIPFYAKSGEVHDEVHLRGRNMNDNQQSKSFFKDLYVEKPYITTTTHEYTPWGKVDYTTIDFVAGWLRQGKPLKPKDTSFVEADVIKLQDSFAEVLRISKKMSLPAHARKNFETNLKVFEGSKNLVEMDLQIRKKYGKSILETDFSANPSLHEKFKQALTSKEKLEKLCEENLGMLVPIQSKQSPLYVQFVHSAITYSDLPTYKAKMKEVFPHPTEEQTKDINQWTLSKTIQLLINGKINSNTALAEWKALVPTINLERFLLSSIDSFVKELVERQQQELNPEVVRFFHEPIVKDGLGDTYDIYIWEYRRKPQFLPRFEAIFGPGKI